MPAASETENTSRSLMFFWIRYVPLMPTAARKTSATSSTGVGPARQLRAALSPASNRPSRSRGLVTVRRVATLV